ncbi:MAG: LysE family transporter [Acidobacteriota bacterium]
MEGLLVGLTLGLAAGLSPGPLLTLVVSTTLQRGFAAGLRLATVPLITDLPIVLMALFVTSAVPTAVLDGLALVGGFVVLWIGFETYRQSRAEGLAVAAETPTRASHDVWRGVVVNIVSPHPWLFWLSIGGPQVVGWYRDGATTSASGFLAGFYATLVGSKIVLAAVVAGGRRRLGGRGHRIALAICAGALFLLGIALVVDGAAGLRAASAGGIA